MSNGVLTIPHHAEVHTNPLDFEIGKTYEIRLGNLTGRLLLHMYRYSNGVQVKHDRSFSTNAGSVSFLYTHRSSIFSDSPIILLLEGEDSTTTLRSITIEEL